MWKNRLASGLLLLTSVLCLVGCQNAKTDQMTVGGQNKETLISEGNMDTENIESVSLTNEIKELENGLSAVKYEGDYRLTVWTIWYTRLKTETNRHDEILKNLGGNG